MSDYSDKADGGACLLIFLGAVLVGALVTRWIFMAGGLLG